MSSLAISYDNTPVSNPLDLVEQVIAAGYEAVATCLASPEVRARTEGVIAWRPEVA